jgi:hypothetical protein
MNINLINFKTGPNVRHSELIALQEVHVDPIDQNKCIVDVDNVQVTRANAGKANQAFATCEP